MEYVVGGIYNDLIFKNFFYIFLENKSYKLVCLKIRSRHPLKESIENLLIQWKQNKTSYKLEFCDFDPRTVEDYFDGYLGCVNQEMLDYLQHQLKLSNVWKTI